ncbi:MAG: universal stress protein [Betaproteobacteria bacterium]|nr:universal stress protein [Betaproteobacteria bacterium]
MMPADSRSSLSVLRQVERMYQRILVPVDNSKHSDGAVRLAASLAKRLGSTVIGLHVYAARLHETRFHQMEPGLPEPYQAPDELQRQRSVHESLIGEGLRVISDSYLDHAQELCREFEVPFERRLAEGRNYVEVLREIGRDGYDLVAMGALGLGARRRSLIGGLSERVLRRTQIDVLLARKPLPESHGIMVAVDGSADGFRAVERALHLGRAVEQPVEIVSVFDPQFHVVAFRSIAKVLSQEGAKVFRLQDQQKLHEQIIDGGLDKLYRRHLETAARMAEVAGQPVQTTLLTGKPFQRVLDHADERRPFLLVAGRFGLHRTEHADIGNTSENLARLARCSVLIVAGELTPTPEQSAQLPELSRLPWTAEASARLQSVPAFAQGMVRHGIDEYARRHGYAEVTPEVMAEARAQMGM